MMNKFFKNMLSTPGEKVYAIILVLLLGLFTYAGIQGWKIINPYSAEHWSDNNNNRHYHK